jgi:hypothetical protein
MSNDNNTRNDKTRTAKHRIRMIIACSYDKEAGGNNCSSLGMLTVITRCLLTALQKAFWQSKKTRQPLTVESKKTRQPLTVEDDR